MPKVAPAPSGGSKKPSDYVCQLHYKHARVVEPESTTDDGLKRLKDVGDKGTLITAAELGLVDKYRDMKLAGQEILTCDWPYHYSSILYACYGNQYKILQMVEREFAASNEELTRMHTTRCWVGKNSAMVAAYQGHLETMLYIIDLDMQGKFTEGLFTQRDVMGKNAMMWAASQGHTDTIEVLLVRSLYRLLPEDCADPLVLKTRWKLVSLLADLASHCRDYDPGCSRRFFQEVLASINYDPIEGARLEEAAAAGGGASAREGAALHEPTWAVYDGDEEEERARKGLKHVDHLVAKSAASTTSVARGGGGGGGRRESAGSGGGAVKLKDVHITVRTLQGVIVSAYRAGMNCMGVIMYCQSLLQQARYFDDLVAQLTAWEVKLLDTCRNKQEVQAILAPTDDDPSEPVGYALSTFDKAFLSHKFVQQIFTEKWDTMGVTDYTKSLFGVVWGGGSLVVSFAAWVVICPLVVIARSFFSPVQDFMMRGKVIVDSRFPWHVPLYRWLLTQCALISFTVLLSYLVFTFDATDPVPASVAPLNTFLAVWCVAILVDEAQEYLEEGRAEYMSSGWNVMDITMALSYILHYILRIIAVRVTDNINILLVVNDLLAASALMAWFRMVSVFELSSAIGPLIQMMKQMIIKDVTRFAFLVLVILLGFSVGMEALFQEACIERDPSTNECTKYTNWGYEWQKDGLVGGMTFLQYIALGNANPVDFEQKRVTGIIFYIIFAIVTAILLLNLFIAMLADTYTRVSTQAMVEFRYRKAKIMAAYSRRDFVCPPYNLLHLVCGSIGNSFRRLVWGPEGFTPVNLRKNETVPLFSWYFPQGEEMRQVVLLQRRVVDDFLSSNRVALFREKLNAELPNLVHQMLKQKGQGDGAASLTGGGSAGAAAAASTTVLATAVSMAAGR
ncbi:hypothetical protein HYH02_005682 [Chlamydomonas schloesseri]|uniref:Ion transport domain-containing protein n=1 Tax=Chlamydomonas schloesseri TaxID=2026947 RepID=A0A836B774_9CHLO|nr:hypothetical protein HYH02_005682 [Chlamydomonas schloesseri]|eukprot:KAG2449540.1 hypothetical protein HYH02_005682 [Chlamydomonas schloesseri]